MAVTTDMQNSSRGSTLQRRAPCLIRKFSTARNVALVSLATGIFPSTQAWAIGWTIEPSIAVSETYTDNITLAPRGAQESEFVTQLNPGFHIVGAGPRIQASLGYLMRNLFYARDSGRNQTYHALAGTGTAELYKEKFFVKADATYSQSIIDAKRPVPFSNVTVTDNLTNVARADINPYFVQRLGSWATGTLSYTRGFIDYRDVQGENLTRTNSVARLESIPGHHRLSWRARYENETVDYDSGILIKYKRAALQLGYALTPKTQFLAEGGRESDIRRDVLQAKLDANFWNAGFRYSSGEAGEFEARYGRRFFGRTYYLNWTRERPWLDLALGYTEEPTTVGLQQFTLVVVPQEITNPTAPNLAPITPEIFIGKNLRGDITFKGRVNSLGVSGYSIDRNYIDTGDSERERLVAATWGWQFAPRTKSELSIGRQSVTFRGSPREDVYRRATLVINHTLARKALARIGFRHERRHSDTPENEYQENAVYIEYRKVF